MIRKINYVNFPIKALVCELCSAVFGLRDQMKQELLRTLYRSRRENEREL